MSLKITRAQRTVNIVLDGALEREYREAVSRLDRASREAAGASDDRLTGGELSKARQEVNDLYPKVEAATVTFVLQAIPVSVWDKLVTSNPPKTDIEKTIGYELVPVTNEAVKAGFIRVENHEGKSLEFGSSDWDDFAQDLSSGQLEEFATIVFELNRGKTAKLDLPAAALLKTVRGGKN